MLSSTNDLLGMDVDIANKQQQVVSHSTSTVCCNSYEDYKWSRGIVGLASENLSQSHTNPARLLDQYIRDIFLERFQ